MVATEKAIGFGNIYFVSEAPARFAYGSQQFYDSFSWVLVDVHHDHLGTMCVLLPIHSQIRSRLPRKSDEDLCRDGAWRWGWEVPIKSYQRRGRSSRGKMERLRGETPCLFVTENRAGRASLAEDSPSLSRGPSGCVGTPAPARGCIHRAAAEGGGPQVRPVVEPQLGSSPLQSGECHDDR